MINRWSEKEAALFIDKYKQNCGADVALQAFATSLIGSESDLSLHGGGNTSVKTSIHDILGKAHNALFVKASGFSMTGFTPERFVALDLDYLITLQQLDSLDDQQMDEEFRLHLLRPHQSRPSIESLLHAFLPFTCIDHSHPTSILALTNRVGGEQMIYDALGPNIGYVPYVRSGFDLAKHVLDTFTKRNTCRAIVLGHHGLVAWGDTARSAYDTTIELATKAENFIKEHRRLTISGKNPITVQGARERFTEFAPMLRGCSHQSRVMTINRCKEWF